MTGLNKKTSLWLIRALAICTVFAMVAFAGGRVLAQDDNKPWVAPDDARKVKNPLTATPENLATAAQSFSRIIALFAMGIKARAMASLPQPARYHRRTSRMQS